MSNPSSLVVSGFKAVMVVYVFSFIPCSWKHLVMKGVSLWLALWKCVCFQSDNWSSGPERRSGGSLLPRTGFEHAFLAPIGLWLIIAMPKTGLCFLRNAYFSTHAGATDLFLRRGPGHHSSEWGPWESSRKMPKRISVCPLGAPKALTSTPQEQPFGDDCWAL